MLQGRELDIPTLAARWKVLLSYPMLGNDRSTRNRPAAHCHKNKFRPAHDLTPQLEWVHRSRHTRLLTYSWCVLSQRLFLSSQTLHAGSKWTTCGWRRRCRPSACRSSARYPWIPTVRFQRTTSVVLSYVFVVSRVRTMLKSNAVTLIAMRAWNRMSMGTFMQRRHSLAEGVQRAQAQYLPKRGGMTEAAGVVQPGRRMWVLAHQLQQGIACGMHESHRQQMSPSGQPAGVEEYWSAQAPITLLQQW